MVNESVKSLACTLSQQHLSFWDLTAINTEQIANKIPETAYDEIDPQSYQKNK